MCPIECSIHLDPAWERFVAMWESTRRSPCSPTTVRLVISPASSFERLIRRPVGSESSPVMRLMSAASGVLTFLSRKVRSNSRCCAFNRGRKPRDRRLGQRRLRRFGLENGKRKEKSTMKNKHNESTRVYLSRCGTCRSDLGTASTLIGVHVAGAEQEEPVRLALIGCGGMGRGHLRGLVRRKSCGHVRLAVRRPSGPDCSGRPRNGRFPEHPAAAYLSLRGRAGRQARRCGDHRHAASLARPDRRVGDCGRERTPTSKSRSRTSIARVRRSSPPRRNTDASCSTARRCDPVR